MKYNLVIAILLVFLRAAESATGLWGLFLRSPVHGGVYEVKDGVPIVASLKVPEMKCKSCPEPKLPDNSVICFWLNGNLQNCVRVDRLVDEDLKLHSLEAGIYSFRAQLFGIAENSQTYPLSSAETVSFTAVSEHLQDIPRDEEEEKVRERKEQVEPVTHGEEGSVACTTFSSCGASQNCKSEGQNVVVNLVDHESDESFASRVTKLLLETGGYEKSALNENLNEELAYWKHHQLNMRRFRRRELRRYLVSRSSRENLNLVLGGLDNPHLRCSSFGYNVTKLSDDETWLFLTGVSMLNARNQSDTRDLLPENSLKSVILLPGFWSSLTRMQRARIVHVLSRSLRSGGYVVVLESETLSQVSYQDVTLIFEAAGMQSSKTCNIDHAHHHHTSSILKTVVPREFWSTSKISSAQCIVRYDLMMSISSSKFSMLDEVSRQKNKNNTREYPQYRVEYATLSKYVQSDDEWCSDTDASCHVKRVDVVHTDEDLKLSSSYEQLAVQSYKDMYISTSEETKSTSQKDCRCKEEHIRAIKRFDQDAERVVVLNLERRTDRWSNFANRLKDVLNIVERDENDDDESSSQCSWENCLRRRLRWNAVDGSRLDLSGSVVQNIFNTTIRSTNGWRSIYSHRMKSGVLGCALSHLSVWTSLATSSSSSSLSEDNRYWIVLEDDIEFVSNILTQWKHIVSDFMDWDILYLGWTDDRPIYSDMKIENVDAVRLSHEPRSFGGGTFGYAIKSRTAKLLVEHASKYGIHSPVDWFMMSAFDALQIDAAKCTPHLATSPHILFDLGVDSDIGVE
jgi:GR25 family glycosyltransferase involved in LPS biosynthesis